MSVKTTDLIDEMKYDIDQLIPVSKDLKDLVYKLKFKGYSTTIKNKSISLFKVGIDYNSSIRTQRLGDDYTKSAIIRRLSEKNHENRNMVVKL